MIRAPENAHIHGPSDRPLVLDCAAPEGCGGKGCGQDRRCLIVGEALGARPLRLDEPHLVLFRRVLFQLPLLDRHAEDDLDDGKVFLADRAGR